MNHGQVWGRTVAGKDVSGGLGCKKQEMANTYVLTNRVVAVRKIML